MLSEIIRDALRKAIGHDDEVRLVTLGSNRGLIRSRSAANKKAIEACLDEKHGWFDVVRIEQRGKTKHWFVRITDAGVAALLAETPIAEYGPLLDEAAEQWRPQLLTHCAAELDKQHDEILKAQQATHNAAVEFFTKRLQNLDEQREVIAEQREILTTIQQRLQVVAPEEPQDDQPVRPEPVIEPPVQSRERGKLRRPPTDRRQAETAFEYQRDLCEQLVAAWQEAVTPDARDEIQGALLNAGLDPIGEPGEVVEFDGRRHKALESARSGDAVEIVTPGWQLPLSGFPTGTFGEGVEYYVLAKPLVRPAHPAAAPAAEDSAGKD